MMGSSRKSRGFVGGLRRFESWMLGLLLGLRGGGRGLRGGWGGLLSRGCLLRCMWRVRFGDYVWENLRFMRKWVGYARGEGDGWES